MTKEEKIQAAEAAYQMSTINTQLSLTIKEICNRKRQAFIKGAEAEAESSKFVGMLIYGILLRLWKDNFVVVYHIRRKRFDTEKLRIAYITHYKNKRFTKWTIKFRLRNINDSKTTLSKGHKN